MGTGYMGADEPEVVPKGPPTSTEPNEQTLTNLNTAPVEQQHAAETPAPAAVPPPAAKVEPKAGEAAPASAEVKEPEPKIVEKIVEKIIEKHPEFKDEDSKALYEAWTNGEMDKVKAYWREMDKNYDTMSHIDVIREGLAKKNPQWTPADIELELRSEYGKQLEKFNMSDFDKEVDPEAYKEALAHNEQADANALKLERDSRDYRITLKSAQKAIELPKITNNTPPAAEVSTAPTQEQLDEAARNWADMADKQVSLTDYTFQVGDDKNPEEVVFAVTPEENTARKEAMKTWSGAEFMSRRGWTNADGSFNLLNIAKDEHVLENIEKMQRSAYTQGVTNGRKAEVAKIKNIDDQQVRQPAGPGEPLDAGDAVWG
jgi:hypothetical protein